MKSQAGRLARRILPAAWVVGMVVGAVLPAGATIQFSLTNATLDGGKYYSKSDSVALTIDSDQSGYMSHEWEIKFKTPAGIVYAPAAQLWPYPCQATLTYTKTSVQSQGGTWENVWTVSMLHKYGEYDPEEGLTDWIEETASITLYVDQTAPSAPVPVTISATPPGVTSGPPLPQGAGPVYPVYSQSSNGENVVLNWTASSDPTSNGVSTGLVAYKVYEGAGTPTLKATCPLSPLSYTIGDLAAGGHTYRVRAVDKVGNEGTTTPLQFFVDKTAPTAPPSLTSSGGVLVGGKRYVDSSVTLTWSAPTETGSGVANYVASVGTVTASTTLLTKELGLASLSQGAKTASVYAVDHVGNVGPSSTAAIYIDRTAPGSVTVSSLTADVTTVNGVCYPRLNATWTSVTDGPSGSASGVQYYRVYVYQGSSVPGGTGYSQVSAATTSWSGTLAVGDRNKQYAVKVTAVDYLGHEGSGGTATVKTPSGAISVSSCESLPTTRSSSGTPLYTTRLHFAIDQAYADSGTFTAVDCYQIYRNTVNSPGGNSSVTIDSPPTDLEFAVDETIEGSVYAHGAMYYFVKTVYTDGQDEWGASASVAELPNYPAAVALRRGDEVLASTEGPSEWGELAVVTNDLSGLRLTIEDAPDIEGDQITALVLVDRSDNFQEYALDIAAGPPYEIRISEIGLFDQDALKDLRIDVTESKGSWTYQYYADYFTLLYDTLRPEFPTTPALVSSTPPGTTYDADRHTPTASISIADIHAVDPGVVESASGIGALRVWNEDNEGSAQDWAWNEADESHDWVLADAEGTRKVHLRAVDRAGNVSDPPVELVTVLDTTAPTAPDPVFTVVTYDGDHAISISWSDFLDNLTGSDLLKYRVVGEVQGGGAFTASVNTTYCTIDTEGMPANAPISLSVSAIDKAGNESDPVSYDGLHTPATCGALGSTISDAYAGDHSYSVSWTFSASGATGTQLLRVAKPGDPFPTDVGLGEGSTFTISDVDPHATLEYQLVAVNQCGFVTEGEAGTHTVSNALPATPTLVGPAGLSTAQPVFSWTGDLSDQDGDEVTYTLSYKRPGDADWISVTPAGGLSCDAASFPAATFTEGASFTWKVSASDEFGAVVESAEVSFTVDATLPQAALASAGVDFFTNATSLIVSASDSNGISGVRYSSSDGYAIDAGATLSDDGAGTFTAVIPLHESLRDASGNGIPYRMTCTIYDGAGNPKTLESADLRVDWTPPQAPAVALNAPLFAGAPATTTGLFTVTSAGADDYAGLKELAYGFVADVGATPSFSTSVTLRPAASPDGDTTSRSYTVPVTLAGANGASYYLVARLVDFAGNASQPTVVATPVLLDTTAPAVSVQAHGLAAHASRYFLAEVDALGVSASCTDPDTTVAEEIAMVPQGAGAASPVWRASLDAAKGDLVAGGTYAVGVRGTNAAGGVAAAYSAAFTYDPSAPIGLSLQGDDLVSLIPGERVRFRATASDAESGVRKLTVGIGSSPGATDLTALVLGNIGGLMIREAVSGGADFDFALPEAADGTYYLTLTATNGAGASTTNQIADPTLTVAAATEKLVVTDQGLYSSSGDTLRASWFYNGTGDVAGYRYRIVWSGGTTVDWTDTVETSVIASGLALEHARTYRFEVSAVFSDASVSPAVSSRGVTVDLTVPELASTGGFVVPVASPSASLGIGWNVSDAESGIASVELIIESFDELGELVRVADPIPLEPAESAGDVIVAADVSGEPLDLESGKKVILTLRVTNGGGGTVEATANAVTIDDSPPPAPMVVDQGNVINTQQYLEAHWIWTTADPESGTTGFEWAIVSSADAVGGAVWHAAGTERTVDVSTASDLDDGAVRADKAIWYFAVRAVNAAGLTSIGLSDGIVYDATAPYVAKVRLLNAGSDPATSSEVNYVTSAESLAVYIDAYEDQTQDMRYRVDAGSLAGGVWTPSGGAGIESTSSTIPLDGLTLAVGEIGSFRGLVLNEAGLVSEYGYTQGVLLSADAPEVTALHGRMLGTDLYFDWNVVEGVTPVRHSYVALVPVAQASTTPPESAWADVGLDRSVSYNTERDAIPDGQYVLFVKARNAAGLESEPVKSSIVTFDVTAPSVTSLTVPRFASTKAAIEALTRDDESGISEYLYAVGTFEDPVTFSQGWVSRVYRGTRLATDVVFAGLPAVVPDGALVRVSMRVRNGAGLWCDAAMGGSTLIDWTAAATPVVSAGEYTVFSTKVHGIDFGASDLQSGVTLVRIAPVATLGADLPSGAEEIVVGSPSELVSEVATSDYTLDGLDLEEAGRYYIAVQARNGAGDWSAIGYSGAIVVDTIAPEIVFEDGSGSKVVNQGPTTVGFSLSEDARVEMTFVKPGGAADTVPAFDGGAGAGSVDFPYTDEGTYRVAAVLTDKAGNVGNLDPGARALLLRINAAPKVYLDVYYTTPGQPRLLAANAYDPDGDTPLEHVWALGDGSGTSIEETPTHAYFHAAPTDQVTEYTVTLTVTDALGKSATASSKVVVENTVLGTLFADEYWSGTHEVRGDLVVPAGITLTVAPGAAVSVTGAYRITVAGGLISGSGSSFGLKRTPPFAWDGIVVSGTATLQGTEVRDAERGLAALTGSVVSIAGCAFRNNVTGVHAYGSSPQITSTLFQGSSRYAVKEDQGGRPTVTSCTFTGNLYDYYSEIDAVIGVDKLNTINGSSGNTNE